ncbi:MAG TPA: PspC domain-containing protein [Candidatus Hydrothermia bacterium]|jgi:phage shock protein C|nr:PspC domain-containing protein [Candidatus Hydrothermae bacterium]MDD3648768.1 PspC domain-containing protein [Candidatus Hydrothermia bacterium]MDD5572901.1 PspC domain-containing protein [Candidatus Hydrothermia bacterium]HOK23273.1 PspC domain-containing protein [Candidatus Hydrothermia bacterium]HOL24082.1 PspC domain-containing protein [Candidatus Hydrothermia bacterium]
MGKRKLFRVKKDRLLGGVCTGLAEYLNVDVVFLRLLLTVLILTLGVGILFYLVAWIIIPMED